MNRLATAKTYRAITTLLVAAWVAGCAAQAPCTPVVVTTEITEVTLAAAVDRDSRVTVTAPIDAGVYPLIVFSHGAFAAPERYQRLLDAWASQGYVVAAPLHIDSELIQHEAPPTPQAVWQSRLDDVTAIVEQARTIAGALNPGVELDSTQWIATGHSYGAFVVQVMGGAASEWPAEIRKVTPPGAVIAFSPPGPIAGFIPEHAWASMTAPQIVLTGTGDILPGFIDDWTLHTLAFDQAQGPDQWLWIGEGVDHYFGRVIGRLDRDVPPQEEAFVLALDATNRFLRDYSRNRVNSSCSFALAPAKEAAAELRRRR